MTIRFRVIKINDGNICLEIFGIKFEISHCLDCSYSFRLLIAVDGP